MDIKQELCEYVFKVLFSMGKGKYLTLSCSSPLEPKWNGVFHYLLQNVQEDFSLSLSSQLIKQDMSVLANKHFSGLRCFVTSSRFHQVSVKYDKK